MWQSRYSFPLNSDRPPSAALLAVGVSDALGCELMSVEGLQSAVTQLPAEELDRFSQWLEEFLAEQWNRRTEANVLAGRIDAAGCRADADFGTGRCTPLPR
jgi:hypothetical protein